MIGELRVRDLATIADVTLPLGPGLNVLTGETGAGKSMLVDALALLLGGRGDSGAIRPGAAKTVVEGVFEDLSRATRKALDAMGLDSDEDRLVMRREISAEGRSRAWINGSPATVSVLEQVGRLVVDLHGQHQTLSLLTPETQRKLLDGFSEAEAEADVVAQAAAELDRLVAEEQNLLEKRETVRRKADYLRHVVQEIDEAKLVLGEEVQLETELRRLGQAEQLRELADRVAQALDDEESGALTHLAQADRGLGQLERAEPAATEWRPLLEQAFASLEELARLARDYRERLEDDPGRLAELEERGHRIDKLCRKYGENVAAVLATRAESAAELDLLDTAELDLKTLTARVQAATGALAAAAERLTSKRREGSERLARAVSRLLPKLGLPGARFGVELTPLPVPGARGAETVQFLVQLNAGLDARPLSKVASGGELARLMLALKVVFARQDEIPTMVLDEVDQGIGGEVGSKVGEALAEAAARHQVLVITHLPQIAAQADRHLVVVKRAKGGVATSDVEPIHGEDRVNELARMLGDGDSDAARRHAAVMLKSVKTKR